MDLTLLTLQEAAQALRSSIHFVRGLIADDELKFVKCGKQFCIARHDLDEWIKSNRVLRTDLDAEVGDSLGQEHVRRLKSVG
jgi:excisionase family DNA binding protein